MGKKYRATATTSDKDISDKLKMTITNLPSGFYQGSCSQSQPWYFFPVRRYALIACTVEGNPRTGGSFSARIVVKDNKSGFDEKFLAKIGKMAISPEWGKRVFKTEVKH